MLLKPWARTVAHRLSYRTRNQVRNRASRNVRTTPDLPLLEMEDGEQDGGDRESDQAPWAGPLCVARDLTQPHREEAAEHRLLPERGERPGAHEQYSQERRVPLDFGEGRDILTAVRKAVQDRYQESELHQRPGGGEPEHGCCRAQWPVQYAKPQ